MADKNDNTSNRGFASMPKSKVKKIAQKGGEASHGGGSSQGADSGTNLSDADRSRGGQNDHKKS